MRATKRSGHWLKDERGFVPWYLILLLMGGAAAVTTFVGTRTVAENRQERAVGGVTFEETFDDAPQKTEDPCAKEQGFLGDAVIIPVQLSSCPKPEDDDDGPGVTGRVGDDTPSVQRSHPDPDPGPQHDPGVIYVDPGAYEDPHDGGDDGHGGTSGGSNSSTTNCVNGVCTSSGGGGTSSGGDGHSSGGDDGHSSGGDDGHSSGGGGGTS